MVESTWWLWQPRASLFDCSKLSIEKHIGRDSFGEVFLSVFSVNAGEEASKVVVKRMLEVQDEDETKRFIKEVRIMKELKVARIVSWRARHGPLNTATESRLMHATIELKMEYVARARACAPGSRIRK